MNPKLIKIGRHYYIVDDSEITYYDYFIRENKVYRSLGRDVHNYVIGCEDMSFIPRDCKKIIFSTQELKGVHLVDPIGILQFSLAKLIHDAKTN